MNFYEVLNLNTNATEKEIKKAYRVLAKKYHPDTYIGDKDFAQKKMQEINIAYDTLSDTSLRKSYDEKNGINLRGNEKAEVKTTTYSKNQYYYNKYNKAGVNYEVKYRPNNSKIRYDERGYAESNYNTSGLDEFDYKLKKIKIKDLFKGKNLVYTLVVIFLVIGFLSWTVYKAVESINELITSTQAISHKINVSKEETEKSIKEDEAFLKDKIGSAVNTMIENIKSKEQEFIEEYKKNYVEKKNEKEILNDF